MGHTLGIDQAAKQFLSYLQACGRYAPHTIRAYRLGLRRFLAFLGDQVSQPPQIITKVIVFDFVTSLGRYSASTICQQIGSLGSFFGWLQMRGEIEGNPARGMPRPKAPSTLPRVLTHEQHSKLHAAARNPWERAILMLLAMTGIRRAELVGIRLVDIDHTEQTVLVRGKGRKQRLMPLCAEAMKAVRELINSQNGAVSEYLVLSRTGKVASPQVITNTVSQMARRAGIHASPHMLRHTFATKLAREGVDIRTLQGLLGHARMTTTAVYLHSDMRMKRAAVEKLRSI